MSKNVIKDNPEIQSSAVTSSENSENLINGKNQWKKIDKKQTNKLKKKETTSRA